MKQFLLGPLCLAALAVFAGDVLAFGHHNQQVFRQHTVIKGGVGVNVGVPVGPGNSFNRGYYVQQAPVLVQQSPVLVQQAPVLVQRQTPVYTQSAPVIVQQSPTLLQQAPVYTQQVQRSFVQQQQYVQPQQVQLAQTPVQYQQVVADVQQCQTCGVPAASFAQVPSYATGGCATGVGAAFSPSFGTVPTYPTVGVGASFSPGYGTVPSGHGVFRQRTVQRY